MDNDSTDISRFESALLGEFVSKGEIRGVIEESRAIMEYDAVPSTINGLLAEVTETFHRTHIGEKKYYARLFRRSGSPNGMAHGRGYLQEGIVFDETIDIKVRTRNSRVIEFVNPDTDMASIYVENGLDPRVNDPDDLKVIHEILDGIQEKSEAVKTRKASEAQAAEEARRTKRRNRAMRFIKGSGIGTAVVAAVAVVGGAVRLVAGMDFSSTDFDEDPEIEMPFNGTILRIGEPVAHPEFSSYLHDEPSVNGTSVPHMYDSLHTNADSALDPSDRLRRTTIYTSKTEEGENCKEVPVEGAKLDGTVTVWTDFVSRTGQSRSSELTAQLLTDKLVLCFVGQETDKDDDPQFFFRMGNEDGIPLAPHPVPTD